MKLGKLALSVGAIALGLYLQPNVGWSTRVYAPIVTGTVTAKPSTSTIEIDHRSYRIQANSSAAKALSSLHVGETVDMVVDGPPGGTVEVVSIVQHQGS
jgi:hypothetical protein